MNPADLLLDWDDEEPTEVTRVRIELREKAQRIDQCARRLTPPQRPEVSEPFPSSEPPTKPNRKR